MIECIMRFTEDESGTAVGQFMEKIVRCKDCRHVSKDALFDMWWCNGHEVKPAGFCDRGLKQEDIE